MEKEAAKMLSSAAEMNPYFFKENVFIVVNSWRRLGPVHGTAYLLKSWWGKTFLTDYPPPPFHVIVEITTNCNLRCPTCAHPTYEKTKLNLPFKDFVRVLDSVPTARKISLLGLGEPLMHPELPRMIRECKTRKTYVAMFSNATLLNQGNRAVLFDEGLDHLHLSMDGATRETFERYRLGAKFERTIEQIRALAAEKRARKSAMRVILCFTANAENIEELPALVRLAADLDIPEVMVNDIHFFLDQNIELEFAERIIQKQHDHAEDVFKKTEHSAQKLGVRFYTNVENSYGSRTCNWPWIVTFVSINGDVTPCCMNGWDPDALNFGNIYRQRFEQIWHSEKYVAFRREMKARARPAFCENCPGYGREVIRKA